MGGEMDQVFSRLNGIGILIMCEKCGGVFEDLKCKSREIIRHPRRGSPWVDKVYTCRHCQTERED